MTNSRFDELAAMRGQGDVRIRVELTYDEEGRVRRVHTTGLWAAGLPELFLDPPKSFWAGLDPDEAEALTFLFASGLIGLGQDLIEADDFEVDPHLDFFASEPVRMSIARHEAPDGPMRKALGAGVDTVIRIDCSLWSIDAPGPRA